MLGALRSGQTFVPKEKHAWIARTLVREATVEDAASIRSDVLLPYDDEMKGYWVCLDLDDGRLWITHASSLESRWKRV
jgi:hypothetical protein